MWVWPRTHSCLLPTPPHSALLTSSDPEVCFSNPSGPLWRESLAPGGTSEKGRGLAHPGGGVGGPSWECRVGEALLFCGKFQLPWKLRHSGLAPQHPCGLGVSVLKPSSAPGLGGLGLGRAVPARAGVW